MQVQAGTLYITECWNYFHTDTTKCLKAARCPELHTATLKWRDISPNLVVTAGRNKLLDATFKTGLASPAWFVGLKGTGSVVAGDTMGSHAGWADLDDYDEATRPALTLGAIASGAVDNSASKAVFSINASITVAGLFLSDDDDKVGTTGVLYGAVNFSGGSQAVDNGDVLNVQANLSIAAA